MFSVLGAKPVLPLTERGGVTRMFVVFLR